MPSSRSRLRPAFGRRPGSPLALIGAACGLASLGATEVLLAEADAADGAPGLAAMVVAPVAPAPRRRVPSPPAIRLEPEVPRVELEGRVPPHWLSGTSDRRPLTPARWRRRMPAHCKTRGGYKRYCAGPLVMPEPHGPAAVLADRLGLGRTATAMQLLYFGPFPEWRRTVAHLDADRSLTFPVPEGRVGRGFGRTRTHGLEDRPHDGVDIGAGEGATVVAARGGLVAYAGNDITGYGNIVILLHRGGHVTMYAHCRALSVFAGQFVERGEPIGEVGTTGFAPVPHLHFEWRVGGRLEDPADALQPKAVATSDGPRGAAG